MDAFILKNVMVIDQEAKSTEKKDIFIADGVYRESVSGGEIIDLEGCYLAPGFVDMHVHVFEGETQLGICADKVGVRQGVLTVVDAGSTGIRDYGSFKKSVIDKNLTNVKFFINIARQGLCDGLSELADMDDLMNEEELLRFQKTHGEHLVGLKVRMSGSVLKSSGMKPLKHARRLADASGLPIMVHVGNAPPPLGEILDLLKKGDILTHCFHGKEGGICAYTKEYQAAVSRGVHFDVGHGTASFSYKTFPKVMELMNMDYSISTDIYNSNYESPVGSLMQTMSKFLAAGLSIEELVYKVTTLPAKLLGLREDKIIPGAAANGTIFKLCPKPDGIRLMDSEGILIASESIICPVMTIKEGKRVKGQCMIL